MLKAKTIWKTRNKTWWTFYREKLSKLGNQGSWQLCYVHNSAIALVFYLLSVKFCTKVLIYKINTKFCKLHSINKNKNQLQLSAQVNKVTRRWAACYSCKRCCHVNSERRCSNDRLALLVDVWFAGDHPEKHGSINFNICTGLLITGVRRRYWIDQSGVCDRVSLLSLQYTCVNI